MIKRKPTHDDLQKRVKALERNAHKAKRVEEALKIQNAYLELFFDSAPEAIVLADKEHRITRVSPQFTRMFGYTPKEALGKTADELVAGKKKLKEAAHITDQVGHGQKVRVEGIRYKKNGSPVYVDLMAAPVWAGNEQVATYASYRDITERKKIEAALQKSEEQYRTLIQNIPAGIYRCTPGPHGRFLMANPAFLRLFGFASEEELKKTKVSDIYADPGQRKVFSDSLLKEKSILATDRHLKKKDGALLWATVSARVVYHAVSGKAAYFDCAIVDITTSKEAELALKSEKGYLDALHETALGLVSRLEAEEVLRAIVERAARLFGTPHGFIYLYDPDRGDLVLKIGVGATKDMVGFRLRPGEGLAGKVFLSGEPLIVDDYRSWANRSLDSRFDDVCAIVGLPLKSERRVNGVIGLGYFCEDRKFSTSELTVLSRFAEIASIALDNALLYSKLRNELEERQKAEKERRKLESQLHHAQRMQAIGTLAGGIAHDFNNLLMGIQGRTSLMLLNSAPSDPSFEHLKGIEKYVQNAAALTRQLLGFARGGKYEVKPTDLSDLIQRTAQMFGRTKKEIRIHGEYQEGVWTVEVDQSQIEQVLLNLYVNAWQAMPGGGDLYIETRNVVMTEKDVSPYELKAGRYVKVTVADSGMGVDEQTRQRIFEPFFTTKEMGRGTGLGLASAYGIIKNHGGIINVESEKGVGTSFYIYLPVSDKKVTKDPGLEGEIWRGSEGVLLVDDEQMVRAVVEGMLKGLGYQVWVAGSGEEAIEVIGRQRGKIQLVILDMIMPGLSGGETFDSLKRLDPGLKVLLSSGYSLNGEAKKIMDRGCDGFIQKPFSIKELSAKAGDLLGQRK